MTQSSEREIRQSPKWVIREHESKGIGIRAMNIIALREGMVIDDYLAIRLEGEGKRWKPFSLRLFEKTDEIWSPVGQLRFRLKTPFRIVTYDPASVVKETYIDSFVDKVRGRGKPRNKITMVVGKRGQYVKKISELGITLPPLTAVS